VFWRGAAEELLWFIRGGTDAKELRAGLGSSLMSCAAYCILLCLPDYETARRPALAPGERGLGWLPGVMDGVGWDVLRKTQDAR